jgi:hypothetical protein
VSAQGYDAGCFFERGGATMGANRCAVHHDHINIVRVRHGLYDLIPDFSAGPAIEAVVDCDRRPVLPWQIGSGDAGAQDVKDAIDHAPVISPLHPTRLVWRH